MKVALVHDYLKEYGGAERVLEALHELYPDAPVYTSVYLPQFLGPHRDRFSGWDIRTSWAQSLPFKSKLISPLRLLAPFLFQSFDFSKYDVVIVSATGAYASNMIETRNLSSRAKRGDLTGEIASSPSAPRNDSSRQARTIKKTVHICYCHTPPRYLYGYATARDWKKNIVFRVLGEIANHFLRIVDFRAAQRVDFFIANSEEVASRIKKFYRRDSVVVYPPAIEVEKVEKVGKVEKGDYFVAGGRLARAKHIDLIIQACLELNVPLKVFGRGFIGEEIKNQISKIKNTDQKSNIEYVGEVSDSEKLALMGGAKAYIFAAEDEDFGITPVEAMSVGAPVIAYKSGGVKETVVNGKTGLFFEDLSVESLKKTIQQFSNITIKPEDCIKQAEKFSKERFLKEIEKFVSSR